MPAALLMTLLIVLAGFAPAWVEREAVAMGFRLHLQALGETDASATGAVDAAVLGLEELESRVSGWRPDSELARLNGAPLGLVETLSSETFQLLERIWDLSARTQGAFDPAIGAYVDVWDLDGPDRAPSGEALAAVRRAAGHGCFDLRRSASAASRECGPAWIDSRVFERGAAFEVKDPNHVHSIVF
jgi:thiamine biosynthesis lipoprotein